MDIGFSTPGPFRLGPTRRAAFVRVLRTEIDAALAPWLPPIARTRRLTRTCACCGNTFALSTGVFGSRRRLGLSVPDRCPSCRVLPIRDRDPEYLLEALSHDVLEQHAVSVCDVASMSVRECDMTAVSASESDVTRTGESDPEVSQFTRKASEMDSDTASVYHSEGESETRVCRDCGSEFRVSASQSAWFEARGLVAPKRCPQCRNRRRAEREAGPLS